MSGSLLPCPFCGENSDKVRAYGSDAPGSIAHVACELCEASGPRMRDGTRAEAIEAWNRRASAPFVSTHRHHKGAEYQALFRAIVTDDVKAGEPVMIYRNAETKNFARPAWMFSGTIGDGRQRFEPIPEQDRAAAVSVASAADAGGVACTEEAPPAERSEP